MPNFERIRPYDESRMLFRLFAQLLKELKRLPMSPYMADKLKRMEMETEEFLVKQRQNEGLEFNLERFRYVSDPRNPQEVPE